MSLVQYKGIGTIRKVQHERLGDKELVFTKGVPAEVTDEQAAALNELCPGEFVAVDAPAASQEQGTEAATLPLGEEPSDEGDSSKKKTGRSKDA